MLGRPNDGRQRGTNEISKETRGIVVQSELGRAGLKGCTGISSSLGASLRMERHELRGPGEIPAGLGAYQGAPDMGVKVWVGASGWQACQRESTGTEKP